MTEENNRAVGSDRQVSQQTDELADLAAVDFIPGEHVCAGINPDVPGFQIPGLLEKLIE